jgi:hypothetical protein
MLWWQELRLGRKMELDISGNKVVFPIFWRPVAFSAAPGGRQ